MHLAADLEREVRELERQIANHRHLIAELDRRRHFDAAMNATAEPQRLQNQLARARHRLRTAMKGAPAQR
jgi:predicted  nucleic acid-binding Zn-ribbon protein